VGISNLARRTRLDPTGRFIFRINDSSNAGCNMIWNVVCFRGNVSGSQCGLACLGN
jgi:hypothetical protein